MVGGAGGVSVKMNAWGFSKFGENWRKKSSKMKKETLKAPPNLSLYCNTLLTELQRMLTMAGDHKDAPLIR